MPLFQLNWTSLVNIIEIEIFAVAGNPGTRILKASVATVMLIR